MTASAPQATARARLVDGRHHRQQTRSGGARRLGHGRGVVERRDRRRRPPRAPASTSATGAWQAAGSGGSSGQPELAPERLQHLEDALALARRRRRLRELRVDAERAVRRQLARAREIALEAPRPSCPTLRRRPSPPARVTAATSSGVAGPFAMPASRIGTRIPSRSQSGVLQAAAHSSLDPAHRLMPLSVAWRSISASSSRAEVAAVERADIGLELRDAARADERRGHARIAQRPGQRHLRERLPASPRDRVERADLLERLLAEQIGRERALRGSLANRPGCRPDSGR